MIANALTIPIGLWLAYSAIFPAPIGGTNDTKLMLCGLVLAVLAFVARGASSMAWQTTLNIVLGLSLALFAGARMYLGDVAIGAFWVVLLTGIAVATAALWSILYRAEPEKASSAV